ncbi:MAG: pseudouridine synthase, partial [Myxococcota bacterium]
RERVYPVGRLDFNSRGLIILTNDGDLSALLTHPRNKIVKTYHVKFQGKLDDKAMQTLREGVTLEDGTVTRPAVELFVVKETAANTWVQLAIAQGLNRQIRRMGDAIGHSVLKLIRVSIGDLTTDGIEEGAFRPLSHQDLERLRAYDTDRR